MSFSGRRCSVMGIIIGVGLLCVLLPIAVVSPAFAGQVPELQERDSLSDAALCASDWVDRANSGIQAAKDERIDQALSHLQPVVEADPDCYLEEHGAVAYWVGKMLGLRDEPDRQLEIWRDGLNALETSEKVADARLADAFLQEVFQRENTSAYERAVEAYYTLLTRTGIENSAWQARPIAQHLRLVAGILPASMRNQYSLSQGLPVDSVRSLSEEFGAELVSWWRAQDPFPRTIANERVEEHLRRVVHARAEYQHDGRVDDRGMVYVRLGAPYRKTTVQFNSTEFTDHVLSGRSRVTASDFKRGKFWVYDHISRSTQFLFVEVQGGVFKVGDVTSMLPSSVRRSFSSSSRGQREAEVFLRAMKEAYSQLAVYSDRYHSQHQEFANSVMDLDARAGSPRPERNWSSRSIARRMLSDVKEADRYQKEQRKKHTPSSYAEQDESASLPVAVRHTRFLEPNGNTRVEVTWSAASSGFQSSEERDKGTYFLGTTLVERGSDGRRRTYKHESSRLEVEKLRGAGFIEPQTLDFRTDATGAFRIDMQWDQFTASQTGNLRPEERVARTVKMDTIQALDPDSSVLQVSDLQPMLVPQANKNTGPWEKELPYPFSTITLESPLALYFEVYHLTLGAENRTQYTIEYSVLERTDRSLDALELRTAVESQVSGTSRTAEEYILLDLQGWDVEGDEITIAVRVTDERTGERVLRELDFQVRSPQM